MAKRLECPPTTQNKEEEPLLNCSSWIEINLDALAHNLREIQKHTQAAICPILKGDAYGCGAPVLSAFLQSQGLNLLGVSDLEEALEIIPYTSGQILLLTPPLPWQLPGVLKHNLIPTVSSAPLISELGDLARRRRQRVFLHLKVDTGLGRLGAEPGAVPGLAELIKKNPYLKLVGVFTHLARASHRFSAQKQLSRFLELKKKLSQSGWTSLSWHAASSKALVALPSSHLDLVRPGTLLYGEAPLSLDRSWNLQKTWSFHTRLIEIKRLPKNHPIGYGGSFRTKEPTTVGIIPVGYGHGLQLEPQTASWRQIKQGLSKTLKQKPVIFVPGQGPLPILGRIGMGLTCLDLNGFPHLKVGDELYVAMRRVTAKRSLPKVYLWEGRPHCVFWGQKLYREGRVTNRLKDLF